MAARAAKAAKAAARETQVDAAVTAELVSLPNELSGSPLVQRAVRNKVRAQVTLDDFFDRVARGDKVPERAVESAIKLVSLIQNATADLVTRWPKQALTAEGDRLAYRQIPQSGIEWLAEQTAMLLTDAKATTTSALPPDCKGERKSDPKSAAAGGTRLEVTTDDRR